MTLTSIHFFLFLPVVFTIYWLFGNKYRWIVLLGASLYFYTTWSYWFPIVLFVILLINYFCAIWISKSSSEGMKKFWLWIAIVKSVLILLAFKYFSGHLFNTRSAFLQIAFPIGLSYYIFQLLGYVIEVKRGKVQPEMNFAKLALFGSFFPTIISGPVERFTALMPQFFGKHKFSFELLASGAGIATWGFFKKMVIADRLTEFVNPVFENPHNYSGLTLLVTAFFFVIQLYADFSGYTDIVTGIARFFGIELSLNWRRPLLATSLVDFWKRYHISLTSWFHDYVYLSIVSNSRSVFFWIINIFWVFILSALWHGFALTFLLWGFMHGLIYILELIIKKQFRIKKKFPVIGWIFVLLFHTLTLIAFRSKTIEIALVFWKKIVSFDFHIRTTVNEFISLNSFFSFALAVSLIVFLFIKELNEEFWKTNKLKTVRKVAEPAFYIIVFVLIFVLGKFNASEFIYSHF